MLMRGALEALEPPAEARAAHEEYVRSLRAIASDARELAERRGLRGRRALVRELQRLRSYERMVEARQALLGDRQPSVRRRLVHVFSHGVLFG